MSKANKQIESIMIHYHRDDKDYKSWSLWLWEYPQGEGRQFEFNGEDSYGAYAFYPLAKWSNFVTTNNLGFIIKLKTSWNKKDGSYDRKITFSDLKKDNEGIYHIYVKEGHFELYSNDKCDSINAFKYAKFTSYKEIMFECNFSTNHFKLLKNGEAIKEVNLKDACSIVKFRISEDINFDDVYQIEATFDALSEPKKETVKFLELFKTEKFSKKYNYDGPLGVELKDKSTTFRVWSPLSKKILLRVYKNGTPTFIDSKHGSDEIHQEVEMVKDSHGVFSITLNNNLHGYYYTYVVTNQEYQNKEIVDPYAKSSGVNGMRGMIVDFKKVNLEGFDLVKPHSIPFTKLVVYETHIADISSSKTWTNNPKQRKYEKTFLGACLEGTSYSYNGRTVKTGFDHIKELGVNAVQLLPIFDQANNETNPSFNWGYNPVNYNVLEGAYSLNPFDGLERIKEFKTLVQKYHDAGINIIMDVVYNHVNGAIGSNFDVLMPGYYFRYTNTLRLSNGSGCGNETASDMHMYHKFMIDSLLFWAKEYALGGFRFDLMGLHDLKTMNEITAKLHEFNKDIVIYGEPWCGGGSSLNYELGANKSNIVQFNDFGAFNDGLRDSLIKANSQITSSGWVSNNECESVDQQEFIASCIKGSLNPNIKEVSDPIKLVNYVSCHDNYTISDRLYSLGINDETDIRKMAMLANAIVLTSNGISFILSGEEFLRTKKGVENSYNSSYEINELDYSLKLKNLDIFKNYQKLIYLKKNITDLSLTKDNNLLLDVNVSSPSVISYKLDDEENDVVYQVYHVNGYRNGKPVQVDLAGYKLYLDTINQRKELTQKTSLVPFETLIVYKEKNNQNN